MANHTPEGGPERSGLLDASPKTTFVMGLLTGLVVCLIVGLVLSFTVLDSSDSDTKVSDSGTNNEVAGAQDQDTGGAAASGLSVSNIKTIASDLGLDTEQFDNCLDSGEKESQVTSDIYLGDEAGVRGTPATFINGNLISGALPFDDYVDQDGNSQKGFQSLVQDAIDGKTIEADNAEPFEFNIGDSDNVWGESDATVTLVEFSDIECPYCSMHQSTLDQVMQAFSGQVRLVFKHYPLSFHENAQKAAEATECAADQGEFWGMHNLLFAAAG